MKKYRIFGNKIQKMEEFSSDKIIRTVTFEGYLIRFLQKYFNLEKDPATNEYPALDLRPSGLGGKYMKIGFSVKAPQTKFCIADEGAAKSIKVIVNQAQWWKIKKDGDYYVHRAAQALFNNTFMITVNTLVSEGYGKEESIHKFEDKYDLINEIYSPDMLRQTYYRLTKRLSQDAKGTDTADQ